MTTVHTVTNHHDRPLLSGHELTDAERAELDYVDWAAVERGEGSWEGFRYRGSIYDLAEFEAAPAEMRHLWQGWQTSSYFDAVAVRFGLEEGTVVVAHVHW